MSGFVLIVLEIIAHSTAILFAGYFAIPRLWNGMFLRWYRRQFNTGVRGLFFVSLSATEVDGKRIYHHDYADGSALGYKHGKWVWVCTYSDGEAIDVCDVRFFSTRSAAKKAVRKAPPSMAMPIVEPADELRNQTLNH